MRKLTSILQIAALLLTSGCLFQIVHNYPSAKGRVIDARTGQPIPGAEVSREIGSAQTNKTITDVQGRFHFHGQRSVQFLFGDHLWSFPRYRISASGYEPLQTNGFPTNVIAAGMGPGPSKQNLGELPLSPSSSTPP